MEKYVVDTETVQANKAKSPSPTTSLPGAWRYSSNIRAPPPLSYNSRQAPFYPPAGAKQPPSTSPKIKPKTKAKTKPPPHKHVDALDVLKHQPYQLDSSLFRYNVGTEAEGLSPSLKMAPIPTPESNPQLSPKPAPVVSPRPAFAISPYSYPAHDLPPANQQSKPIAPAKSTRSVSVLYPFDCQPTQSSEPLPVSKQLDWKHNASPAVHDSANKAPQAPSTHCPIPTSTPCQLSLSVNSASLSSLPFDADVLSRGTIQMAPRPTFSAKKQAVATKQWRHVVLQH